jgi:hypothetical protein
MSNEKPEVIWKLVPGQRYPTGAQIAAVLRECAGKIKDNELSIQVSGIAGELEGER